MKKSRNGLWEISSIKGGDAPWPPFEGAMPPDPHLKGRCPIWRGDAPLTPIWRGRSTLWGGIYNLFAIDYVSFVRRCNMFLVDVNDKIE